MVTTLDTGNASHSISGLSFVSKNDWIIGRITDGNIVTLTTGDSATMKASGKAIFIGQNEGSDNTTRIVAGNVDANEIFNGSVDGNEDNTL